MESARTYLGDSSSRSRSIETAWWEERRDHLEAGLGYLMYRASGPPLEGRDVDFEIVVLEDELTSKPVRPQALILPLLTPELLADRTFTAAAGAKVAAAARERIAVIAATALGEVAFVEAVQQSYDEPWDLDVEALVGGTNLVALLEMVCLARVSGGDAAYLTPIEARLARELDRRQIPYRRQHFIHYHCVDFLVGENLVVECDGVRYHDAEADHVRDSGLRKRGYQVLRLPGSLIHHDVAAAATRVETQLVAGEDVGGGRPIVLDTRLTAPQIAAIQHEHGPARVSAPAGSGKTRVIEERVKALVSSGAQPSRICAISFTNRAVGEMQKRLDDGPTGDVFFTTIHSLAKAISEGGPNGRRRRLVQAARSSRAPTRRTVLAPLLTGEEKIWRWSSLWLEAIGEYRQSFVVPDLADFPDEHRPSTERFLEVHHAYDAALEEGGLTDFEGYILNAVRALARSSSYREDCAARYDHWIVDEYQDLPTGKLELLRLLVAPRNQLFVVGDDDQTIYGFAGATPEAFTGFTSAFPRTSDYVLDTNFRCNHEIVVRSSWLIGRNQTRIEKHVRPFKTLESTDTIRIGDPANYEHEALRFVKAQLRCGVKHEKIALLFRLKDFAGPVELQLERADIPYVGCARASFFERRAVKALRAWLRLADGTASPDDVRETLKWPKRYLTAEHLDLVSGLTPNPLITVETAKRDGARAASQISEGQKRHALESWCELLDRIPEPLAPAAVLDVLDLQSVVEELDADAGGAPPSVTFDVFRRLATEFSRIEDFEHWIATRGSDPDYAFDTPEHGAARAVPGRVLLASVHAVKGQEFDSVAVLGPPEGMPDRRATTPEQLEEERRIAYVAVTRAESALLFAASNQYATELSTSPAGLSWARYRTGHVRSAP